MYIFHITALLLLIESDKTRFGGHTRPLKCTFDLLWAQVQHNRSLINVIVCNQWHKLLLLQAHHHGNRHSCGYLGLHGQPRGQSSNTEQDHPGRRGAEGLAGGFVCVFSVYESAGNATGETLVSLCVIKDGVVWWFIWFNLCNFFQTRGIIRTDTLALAGYFLRALLCSQ